MTCGSRCFEIGGPWISFDPQCPIHGLEAQRRESRGESEMEELRALIEDLRNRVEALEDENNKLSGERLR